MAIHHKTMKMLFEKRGRGFYLIQDQVVLNGW